MRNPAHKIIISGTGRAGTTFLVQLLTALDQPTGYDERTLSTGYFSHCEAGLERRLMDPEAPYIVKDPDLCVTLEGFLAGGGIIVDHAIVPVRDLESAALSRIRVGGANGTVPGGLVGTDDPGRQRAVLADRFHRLICTLVAHDVPHTFLQFPRFVRDPEYTYSKLRPIFPGIDRAQFDAAFRATANPSLIHEYEPGTAAPSPIAREFLEAQRSKRRRRRARRLGLWSALAAGILLAFGSRPWRPFATAAAKQTSPARRATSSSPAAVPPAPSRMRSDALPVVPLEILRDPAGLVKTGPRTFTSSSGAPDTVSASSSRLSPWQTGTR